MGRQPNDCNNAKMFTITFPASLIYSSINSTVYTKYFQPVISEQIEGFKIASDNPYGQEIRAILTDIYSLNPSTFGYELVCLKHINQLWMITLRYIKDKKADLIQHIGNIQSAKYAKEILSYIHTNYKEKITIDKIAKHVNISRSECFRCFKRFMNKKPVEYINEYRLMKAAKLLRETDKSIASIYTECGYESASYFAKIFKKIYSMTPLEYRKLK
jgi:AraC-like DNA-binding protein